MTVVIHTCHGIQVSQLKQAALLKSEQISLIPEVKGSKSLLSSGIGGHIRATNDIWQTIERYFNTVLPKRLQLRLR